MFDALGTLTRMEDRPPVVRLSTLGHGARLLAWYLRPDGEWWAHLLVVDFTPNTGFGRSTTFYTWQMSAHASLLEQRDGWDYTKVQRFRA